MLNIILAAIMIGVFTVGFFAVRRFYRYRKNRSRRITAPKKPDQEVYLSFSDKSGTLEVSEGKGKYRDPYYN